MQEHILDFKKVPRIMYVVGLTTPTADQEGSGNTAGCP